MKPTLQQPAESPSDDVSRLLVVARLALSLLWVTPALERTHSATRRLQRAELAASRERAEYAPYLILQISGSLNNDSK